MKRFKYDFEKAFCLNGIGIDSFSEALEEKLVQLDIERQNRLRIRLSIEEALLRMRDHFGEEAKVVGRIQKRFGKPSVEIAMTGDIFNPLSKAQVQMNDWSSSLLTAVGLNPQYSYQQGTNYLRIMLPSQKMNPVLKIIIAIVIGIALGLFFNAILSENAAENLCEQLLDPLYFVWNRILLAVSGPVIFLMVSTTLLNMNAVSEQGGDRRKVVARYFMFSFLTALVAVIIGHLFFRPNLQTDALADTGDFSILQELFSIIPDNVFNPLIQANTPQILIMAFALGWALIVLGDRVNALKSIVRQLNMIGLLLAAWISRLVPYFAAILICMQIIKSHTVLLTGLWKVLLLALAASLITMASSVLVLSITKKVPAKRIMQKLWRPFAIALKNGSLDASFGLAEHSCVYDFGIEKNYASVSLSQGLVLFMPINVIGTLMFTVFAASKFDIDVSFYWFVIAMILAVVLFVATPPVPGANLLAYIVIFAQLGIASQALIDAMIFDIVFGIFAAAANQALLQIELTLQADKIGLLDIDRLRK